MGPWPVLCSLMPASTFEASLKDAPGAFPFASSSEINGISMIYSTSVSDRLRSCSIQFTDSERGTFCFGVYGGYENMCPNMNDVVIWDGYCEEGPGKSHETIPCAPLATFRRLSPGQDPIKRLLLQ